MDKKPAQLKPMELIKTRLAAGPGQLKLGQPLFHQSLGIFPLVWKKASGLTYLTYDQAMAQESVLITEVDGGSVPVLRVINQAKQAVLIVYGEQLVGAKQNRIINTSVLVEASSKVSIPVTCVEAGRWHLADSPVMQRSDHPLFMTARAKNAEKVTASLRASDSYCGDQGQVWEDISEIMSERKVNSHTSAMDDLYKAERHTLDEYLDHLGLEEFPGNVASGMVGAVFALGDRVAGLEAFDKPATLALLWEKLLLSYAVEAVAVQPACSVTAASARAFLESTSEAQMQEFPSPGLGTEVRIDGPRVAGGSLTCEGEAVHIYAFRRLRNTGHYGSERRGMASYRNRAHGRGESCL